ncbi:hypothetical protein AGDE_13275 [Angomonas deanei]|uniref:Uncharacterized protein n=1 Tax=Angomonas deanei TaxID=59799 RepID=A0A7G2C5P3_9TRYP|nr:hypothetical protein AGDE_13275 [Angomonas deanei]CAD2214474.1 hypothetical protein, conserved [Angomonas deanei]|eukprot:EPY22490.1 hypothetical protein AGDE_13275 [Angomonas deanei]
MDPVLGLSAQCKEEQYTVEHCTTYYLTLGRYCARYLTHKALQLTLLPPYGQLYTILTGMRCIGLLQKGSIAYAVGEVWQRYIERVLDQRNSLEGGGAGGLGGPLRAVIKKRHPSLSREEGDGQQHLQPSCRLSPWRHWIL